MNLTLAAMAACIALSSCAQPSTPTAAPDFTEAAESTINGVVSIKSYVSQQQYRDPMIDFFFGAQPRRQQPREQQLGLGSGVILSEDGYLVTNNHVIEHAQRLEVTLNDNRTFDAQIVGRDPMTDLALLKIDAEGLPVIPMGDSDELRVGQWVLAVGNPFGFTSTVTAGIVSAKARSISSATRTRTMTLDSFIQTDAAVNSGNSGGALVNTDGELVGINTAIYSQTGNYAGYSFAIPSSVVTKVVADIKEFGSVQRAVLGISFRELDANIAKRLQIDGANNGILVLEVIEESAAEAAGLRPGDVVIELNEAPTHTAAQLQEQMARLRPGDVITMVYIREGEHHSSTTRLSGTRR